MRRKAINQRRNSPDNGETIAKIRTVSHFKWQKEITKLRKSRILASEKSYLIMRDSDDYEYANLSESFSDERECRLRDGSESEDNDDEFLAVARNWYQISTNQPNVATPRYP
ncbi:hypothetical protein TNIN_48291 [Trichonephila inaurata madagascariensis]|uniref:Uncharacterized protein n=1 Tax=Trichonephila inaurata madagascariensis TaxID=2747483 RepID=A0A8X7CM74_9ARAC|nr:hypothetical protein TNIN_48291 [Trichonephila inaurata madagascariensis]